MGPKTLVAWAGMAAGAALSGCTGTGSPVGGRTTTAAAVSKPAGSMVQQPQQAVAGPRDPSAWANQPAAFTGRQPNATTQPAPTGNPPAFAGSPANGIIPAGATMPPSGMPQPAPLPPAVNMPPANGITPAGGLMPTGSSLQSLNGTPSGQAPNPNAPAVAVNQTRVSESMQRTSLPAPRADMTQETVALPPPPMPAAALDVPPAAVTAPTGVSSPSPVLAPPAPIKARN